MVRVIPVLCGCYASFIPLLIMRYSAAVLLIPACHSPATPLLFPCYSLAIMALLWLYFFRCFLFIYLYAPPQKRRSSRRKSRGEAVVRSGRGRGRRSARRRQRARRQRHLAKRRPQAAGAPPLAAFENIAIAIGFSRTRRTSTSSADGTTTRRSTIDDAAEYVRELATAVSSSMTSRALLLSSASATLGALEQEAGETVRETRWKNGAVLGEQAQPQQVALGRSSQSEPFARTWAA